MQYFVCGISQSVWMLNLNGENGECGPYEFSETELADLRRLEKEFNAWQIKIAERVEWAVADTEALVLIDDQNPTISTRKKMRSPSIRKRAHSR